MSASKGHSLKEIQHDRTFLTSIIVTTILSCTVVVLLVLITVLYLRKKRRKKNVAAPKRELVLPSHNHLDSTKVEMLQRVSDDEGEKLLAEHLRKISIPQQVFAASVPFNQASSKIHEKVLGSRLSKNAFRSSFNKLTPGVSNTNLLNQKASSNIERRSGEIQYNFSRSMSVPTVKEAVFFNEDGDKMWLSSLSMMGASPELIQKKAWNGAHGKVKFAMYFNRRGENELQVKLHEFDDLPLSRETGISVPFVKIYLYPQTDHTYASQDSNKHNSRVEVLSFPRDTECTFTGYSLEKLYQMALKFVILDYDRFSRSEFVAECVVLLDEEPLDGERISKYLSIKKTQAVNDMGNLLISLCYQPNGNHVCIVILKATGLPDTEGKLSDHFVKISLLQNGTILDKRRTHIIKKNTCPVFNERLIFPVDENVIRNLVIVFDVIRQESKIKHEKVGSVILANHCLLRQVTPHEIQHFNEMLISPQRQIAEWHKIVL